MTDKVLGPEPAPDDDPIVALDMAWATPQFSKTKVDIAGAEILADPPIAQGEDGPIHDLNSEEYYEWWINYQGALDVVNNWRSSHSFPLNTFAVNLRRRGRQVSSKCLVAQRIKRLSSIEAKLIRFPSMKLSQMQDIGGCRAILSNIDQVVELVELLENSNVKHKLYDIDDYIDRPQPTGYRGIHLKYRYHSDKQTTYNGLRIEIQIRSQLQHAWATAVETVGTFIRQALKSSQGEAEWLRFFALMGSALARREGTAPVPNTPTGKLLRMELQALANLLSVQSRLGAYGAAIQTISTGEEDAHYYLLELDPAEQQVKVTGFKSTELEEASRSYLAVEKSIQKKGGLSDAVLVSVDSIESLRRAYPNYFLDTNLFMDAVDQALKARKR